MSRKSCTNARRLEWMSKKFLAKLKKKKKEIHRRWKQG